MNKKFIDIYEKEIKKHREEYYQNIILNNPKTAHTHPVITFLIPLVISLLLLISQNFTIISYIISSILLIIINILIHILFTSRIDKNEYLEKIRRHGYRNIEEYELKIKKFITGPEGYYHTLLLDLIERYNINSSTKRITTINNEEYYIWSNNNKDKIYLLRTHSNKKPEINTIPINHIRYFRVDNNTKEVILKTNNNLYKFKDEYITLFNELIKEKRLDNIKTFEPGTYIDDYEIYMHNVKKSIETDYNNKKEKQQTNFHNAIYIIIAISIIIIITMILPQIKNITNIINIALIIGLNISVTGVLNNINKKKLKDEIEIIKELNNNKENIEIFQELKYILGIKDTYDKVYTKEGAEYITWVANGYFHVFLNLIYYNSVYMSVKTSDVKYFKTDSDSCIIKLKDKTLEFTVQSNIVFNKLLPNKEYYWIKNYQNR